MCTPRSQYTHLSKSTTQARALTAQKYSTNNHTFYTHLVDLPQHGAGRHAAVLEEQLASVLRLHAELLELVALAEALGVRVHQEKRDALGAL